MAYRILTQAMSVLQHSWSIQGVFCLQHYFFKDEGIARTTINYAPESPTFGVIAKVSQTGVQW